MFNRFIKHCAVVSFLGLFGLAGAAGCTAQVDDTSAEEETGEAQEALTCESICLMVYQSCIRNGGSESYCADKQATCLYNNGC